MRWPFRKPIIAPPPVEYDGPGEGPAPRLRYVLWVKNHIGCEWAMSLDLGYDPDQAIRTLQHWSHRLFDAEIRCELRD